MGFVLLGIVPVKAQIQFPGEPLGITGQMKAADVIYVLPPLDPLEIEARLMVNLQSHQKTLQFALERKIFLSPDRHGKWLEQDHYRVWRVHIISPEAHSLGLVFNRYHLEPGVKVFVYDPCMAEVKGAFTSGNNKSSGILPVGPIEGEELIVELQVPAGMIHFGELQVESVSHAFLDIRQMAGTTDCDPGDFGCSQVCEIDINCPDGDDWQLTKRSVVRIFTTTQYCTGVLVNNSAYDGTPYVLTAEHCINKEYYADRSVFLFNYESPTCNGTDGPKHLSIAGCDSISVGDSIDFSLVRLSVSPPDTYDAYYAGWDRSDFQTSGTATIHHPWGDVKKISYDFDIPSIPTHAGQVPYADLDDYYYFSFWWIKGWDIGSTEGGSSGCPLFNAEQQVIGLLSGGIARCGDSIGYDAETGRVIYNTAFNYDDYFTRMRMAWDFNGAEGPSLQQWLDPLNTGAISLGGYHPTGIEPAGRITGNRFTLHPNPVSEILQVSGYALNSPITYRIYDLSGKMQLSDTVPDNESVRIYTGLLPPGIYVIRLSTSGVQEQHKFIIAR